MPTALVAVAPDCFVLEDRALPRPRPDQVLVRVARVGLCGTDLHILEGSHPRARFPLALGHEIVGTLDGDDSERGLVVVDPLIACGSCVACRMGEAHVCSELRLIGIDVDGGLAGSVAVDPHRIHRVPAGVDADLAVLAEPLAVAVHAARRAVVIAGDRIAIIGAGPIGLLLAFVVRRLGAGAIFISEPSSARRTFAASLGYEILDPSDPVADLEARTDGSLADVVFDAAGVAPVAAFLPRLVRPGGRVAIVAVYGRPVELDLQAIVFRELTVLGNRVYTPADIDAALALLVDDGQALRPLLGEVVALVDATDAFARLRSGDAVKILVAMDGG